MLDPLCALTRPNQGQNARRYLWRQGFHSRLTRTRGAAQPYMLTIPTGITSIGNRALSRAAPRLIVLNEGALRAGQGVVQRLNEGIRVYKVA